MKLVIIGAGGTTRELLHGLSDLWDVTVIDTDAERLALAGRSRDLEALEGDGSSRVVLDRAGLADADALIAASDNDDVNLEACRLGRAVGVPRLVACAAEPERMPDYQELGVPSFSPDRLTARRIEITLEPRRVSSAAFAEGKAEAIEFRITADSPVQGKRLADLRAEIWLVATILRGGELIVPHGGSVIQPDDLVTVVGAAEDYAAIVRAFTRGEARFPMDFGKQIAVGLNGRADFDGPVAEAMNLTRNSSAEQLLMIHPDLNRLGDAAAALELEAMLQEMEAATGLHVATRSVDGQATPERVAEVAGETSAAVVVVPAPAASTFRSRRSTAALLSTRKQLRRPILFSRGYGNYDRILVPARDTAAGHVAARAAIDLASHTKAMLVGVGVVPPAFIARGDSSSDARRALDRLHEEASVLGVSVKRRLRQGNPARIIEELAGPGLVVLALPEDPSPFRRSVAGHVIENSSSSVLLVPNPGPK